MTTALAKVVLGMLAVIGALVVVDLVIRVRAGRKARRERRLRPGAELAIGEYLAGLQTEPAAVGDDQRGVLLQVGIDALGDLTGSERQRLADLLETLGYGRQASDGLRARRRVVRRRAAEVLSMIATPATVPALQAGLGDADPMVRCTCARALAEIGGDDIQADVASVAGRDVAAVPGLAAAVVLALGSHHPEAIAPLLGDDADPQVQMIAVAVVGDLRLAQLAPFLRDCLSGRDDLAKLAAEGLGRIGDVTAVPALLGLAFDEHRAAPARAAAIAAVGSIGDFSAVPAVDALVRSDIWEVRNAAAAALPRLGEPGLMALRLAADSPQLEIREQAEAVLRS